MKMTLNQTAKLRFFSVAVAVFAADRLSKWAVLSAFDYGERLNLIPGFFDLTLVYNPGAAFSFLADAGGWQKYFFLLLALAVSVWLWIGILKNDFARCGRWGAVMMMGGALANAADRLFYGHVIDYLLFYWQNWYYPAFNVADSFICVGAFLIVWDGVQQSRAKSASRAQRAGAVQNREGSG